MPKLPPKAKPLKKAKKAKTISNKVHASYRWERLSKTYRAHHPICQRCKYLDNVTQTSCEKISVHHIEMINNAPHLAYDWDNLLSLCVPCHKYFDQIELAGKYKQAEQEGKEIKANA